MDKLSATEKSKQNDLRPVLDTLSFDIYSGQKIAIVGPSGSGKNSVAQLLERFYDVSSGAIYINGSDLKSLSVNKFRQSTSFDARACIVWGLNLERKHCPGLPKSLQQRRTLSMLASNL